MFNRHLHVWAACLVGAGALLLAPVLPAALGPRDRASLAPDELERSRGSNQKTVPTSSSCDEFQDNPPCVQPGAACTACTVSTYRDAENGEDGVYDPGAQGGGICGTLYNGVCLPNLACSQQITFGACNAPPGPPNVQPAYSPDH